MRTFNNEIRIRILKNLDNINWWYDKRNEVEELITQSISKINIGKLFYSEGNKIAFLFADGYKDEINMTIEDICNKYIGSKDVDYIIYYPDPNDYEEIDHILKQS